MTREPFAGARGAATAIRVRQEGVRIEKYGYSPWALVATNRLDVRAHVQEVAFTESANRCWAPAAT